MLEQTANSSAYIGDGRTEAHRAYYLDWLKVFLTVLVILHQCVTLYYPPYAWAAKKDDIPLQMFSGLFLDANTAYFMALLFFISGLFVPGSYSRKGATKFLLGRTLRLMVPCVICSLLITPFSRWWNELAKNPLVDPVAALMEQFKLWLTTGGWPTTYNIGAGPTWFLWMLWCFNVAYAILKAASRCEWLALPCCGCLCGANRRQHEGGQTARDAFSNREMLRHTGTLTGILFVTCFAARMVNRFAFNINPLQFYQRGPFVSFMPDLFVTYAIAFALGVFSSPSGWNVPARLPDSWGSWSLWVGGCWWLWAGWLVNVVLRPAMQMRQGVAAFVLSWCLRTFVEQSFCVVWCVGLLVVFRRAYNRKPGFVKQHVVTAAYGAYLVHPLALGLFARVLMGYYFPSAVVNAAVIALPGVSTSWLVAVMLRLLPGAHVVL